MTTAVISEVDFLICIGILFLVIPLMVAIWEIVIGNYLIYLAQKKETEKQFKEWMEGSAP